MIPYVSYLPDRNAMAINAFSLNWADYYSYIFGLFSTNGAILQKVEEEKADAVMVAPLFTTQSWFPKQLQMTVATPVILSKNKDLLTQPESKQKHPLNKMYLCAFKISGKRCTIEDFHRKLPKSYCHPGEKAQRNSMGHISESGCSFVVKNRLMHFSHL